MPALERCVGDVDAFFREHWGRFPLLRRASGSSAFDDLASFDDLDHMVSGLALDASRLRMVTGGEALPTSRYTTSPGPRSRATAPHVDPALVYGRYAEGATIVLESLHKYWRPLTDFCRDLELALGHRLQVNAYITPPGSQGFDVHRDDHDVFVLQVWGSKHWLVYDRDEPEAVRIDADLAAGSTLYIPEGFPHAATTGAEASAHLTVGILVHEGNDVVRSLLELAADEPVFKQRLDSAVAHDPAVLRSTVEGYIDEVRRWLDKVDTEEVAARVARRVMSSAQPVVRGQLRQLELVDELGPETTVVRRRGATCHVFQTSDEVKVLLVDRELTMPGVTGPAMAQIASADRFRTHDLHRVIDPESALVLVRRLVREGLLEVVVGG